MCWQEYVIILKYDLKFYIITPSKWLTWGTCIYSLFAYIPYLGCLSVHYFSKNSFPVLSLSYGCRNWAEFRSLSSEYLENIQIPFNLLQKIERNWYIKNIKILSEFMFLLPNQQFFPLFVVVLVLWILTSIVWRIFWFILFINEQTGRWTVSRRPRSVVGTRRWCWPSLTSTRGVPTQARTWWTQSPTNTVNTTMTGTESITTSKSRRTRQSKSFISILK